MSDDPHDHSFYRIRGAVAEYERTLIAERMRRGRQMRIRAGTLLPWTTPPYGYRLHPDHPRDPARCNWILRRELLCTRFLRTISRRAVPSLGWRSIYCGWACVPPRGRLGGPPLPCVACSPSRSLPVTYMWGVVVPVLRDAGVRLPRPWENRPAATTSPPPQNGPSWPRSQRLLVKSFLSRSKPSWHS